MFRSLVIVFLSFSYASLSYAIDDEKLPSAVVVGTVYCDTCFQHDFSTESHFISGASVAVECKDVDSITRFKEEVKTNEYGEFEVKLPITVRKHVRKINGCTFNLISSSEPHCAVASASTSSSLSLKTRKEGEHIFSAGIFSFKPTQKPNFCNQKQIVSTLSENSNPAKSLDKSQPNENNVDTFAFPPLPFLPPFPPIPFLPPFPPLPPIPFLPPLPPLPPIPFLPPFPPIPFLPPFPNPPSPLVPSPNPPQNAPVNPIPNPPVTPGPSQPPTVDPTIPNAPEPILSLF